MIVQYSETVLGDARLQRYPIQMGEFGCMLGFELPKIYHSFDEVAVALDPILTDLEKRLAQAHAALK